MFVAELDPGDVYVLEIIPLNPDDFESNIATAVYYDDTRDLLANDIGFDSSGVITSDSFSSADGGEVYFSHAMRYRGDPATGPEEYTIELVKIEDNDPYQLSAIQSGRDVSFVFIVGSDPVVDPVVSFSITVEEDNLDYSEVEILGESSASVSTSVAGTGTQTTISGSAVITGTYSAGSQIIAINFAALEGGPVSVADVELTVNGVDVPFELADSFTEGAFVVAEVPTIGDDDITTGEGGDQIDLLGGSDVLSGSVEDFDGDIVSNFGTDDVIIFTGSEVERGDITVTQGSAILSVDTDGDGVSDSSFTLEGDFTDGDFMAVIEGADTRVTFETFLPMLSEGQAIDPDLVNGIINQDFLKGDGSTDFQITLQNLGFAGYNNVVGVYEIDANGNIVDTRILFENANADKSAVARITDVEAGNNLGFFIVQNAADWAATLADDDNFDFVNSSGATANISDGSDVFIAVNDAVVDEMVFHSFSENMNSDGVQHALSGVDVGGQSITVGFEDLTGGGDQDYEDVVFSVEAVDDFAFV